MTETMQQGSRTDRTYAHFHRVLGELLMELAALPGTLWLSDKEQHVLRGEGERNTYARALYRVASLEPYRERLAELIGRAAAGRGRVRSEQASARAVALAPGDRAGDPCQTQRDLWLPHHTGSPNKMRLPRSTPLSMLPGRICVSSSVTVNKTTA